MQIGHVHNTNYIDFAKQVMPIEVMQNAKKVEILYKKEIRDANIVKCLYGIQDSSHYAVVKSEDENILHAIIRLN